MVANLRIRPLGGPVPGAGENYSFEWRMGKPRWLPSFKKPRQAGQGAW
jgi:hypothetical protein